MGLTPFILNFMLQEHVCKKDRIKQKSSSQKQESQVTNLIRLGRAYRRQGTEHQVYLVEERGQVNITREGLKRKLRNQPRRV